MSKANELKWENGLSNHQFFVRIDELGGWPIGAKSVVMQHGFSPYDCYFSVDEDVRDEWNTSIVTADEYYFWKLSEKAKKKLRADARKSLIAELEKESGK